MRAIVCLRYGPPEVLQLQDVAIPSPKDDEVLIRVRAATVMAGDCELRGLRGPFFWRLLLRLGFGLRAPRRKVLGQELAGEIVSIGKDVTRFAVGNQIFAQTGFRLGAYAEYCCLSENGLLSTKPANLTFEEAATFPSAGLYVLPLLRKANVQRGQKVLVIGAAGTMGTLAVQLAKLSEAEVTGVDGTRKLGLLPSIGADEVIDYTEGDYMRSGKTYDVILDMTGKSSFSGCMKLLKEKGVYVMGNLGFLRAIRGRLASLSSGRRVIAGFVSYQAVDLELLKGLIEAKKIRPVIDRRYPLEEIAEAHRYVDTGQKAGNVVITV
jgi:NADPH:quinone reductase-like Zn-dependent oxidoreductase